VPTKLSANCSNPASQNPPRRARSISDGLDPNEDPDQPADPPMSSDQPPTIDSQPQSYNPSVSEGATEGDYSPSVSEGSGAERRAESDSPAELGNEPTASTNKEVIDEPSKENSDEFYNPRNPIGNSPQGVQPSEWNKEFE